MRRAVYAVLVIALLLMSCVPAYGADKAYFQPEFWINNPNVYSEHISKKSSSNHLDGVFKYYFDAQNNIFYTYFSISESSLSENKCDVRLVYTVNTVFDTYKFFVDKEGICDTSYAPNDYFTSEQSFTTYEESNSGLYISAIAIQTGCVHNDVSIGFYANGHLYKIIESIPLDRMTEREAISRTETTDPADNTDSQSTVNDKKTNKNITKNTTTKKNRSTKAKTPTTTKFHYTPNAGAYNSTANTQENTVAADTTATVVYDGSTDDVSEQKKGTLSSATKVCCVIGGVFAIAGVLLLFAATLSKSKKSKIENEE